MCEIGITAKDFNPRILYLGREVASFETEHFHHLHDNVEIICILSGKCIYKIDDIQYPVEKGDIIICNPGFFHGRIVAPGEDVIEFYSGFDNISILNFPKNFLTDISASPILSLSNHKQEFFDCCNEILSVQEKNEPGCDLMLKSLMMKLITYVLICTVTHDENKKDLHPDFESNDKTYIVNTIISYITENYMEEISLDKISKDMYLSPVYISKIFKDEIGDSPINYLIKLRLTKAIEHLKEDRLTIKALSKSVGYSDPYYFSKLFKKYYGSSPKSYKAKLKSVT